MVSLENFMKVDEVYTVRELSEITNTSYARLSVVLLGLLKEGKATFVGKKPRYWTLTQKAYLEGTVKKQEKLKTTHKPYP
jgi:hypothetical protein